MQAAVFATIVAAGAMQGAPQITAQAKLESKSGPYVTSHYNDMWDLCNKVYSEYPYLYTAEGKDYVYKYYLDSFEKSPDSSLVLAFDQETNKLVGLGTGIRMSDYAAKHYKQPFTDKGYDLNTLYYIADLLILPAYRGKGYEQKMCQELEKSARQNPQLTKICYVTINEAERTKQLKPQEYCPNEPFLPKFWQDLGFEQSNVGFTTQFEIVGETDDTPHDMTYWIKDL